jgi:hypothetical protein
MFFFLSTSFVQGFSHHPLFVRPFGLYFNNKKWGESRFKRPKPKRDENSFFFLRVIFLFFAMKTST